MNLDFIRRVFYIAKSLIRPGENGSVIKSICSTTLTFDPNTQTGQAGSHMHACHFCCGGQRQVGCLGLLAARRSNKYGLEVQ